MDEQEAKKAARAARFGLPTPEPKPTSTTPAAAPTSTTTATAAATKTKAAPASKAKAAPAAKAPAVLDPVEEEKKRKRAERFGTVVTEPEAKKVKTA